MGGGGGPGPTYNTGSGKGVDDDDDDSPLPLPDLRHRVTAETYAWLEASDARDAAWEAELLERSPASANANLFDDDEDEGDDDGDEPRYGGRVCTWTSSPHRADGIGGYYDGDGDDSGAGRDDGEELGTDGDADADVVRVRYILSSASGGHGDDLWAASRHVANLLADADKCRALLSPMFAFAGGGRSSVLDRNRNDDDAHQHHPLRGRSLCELGAGGGVPSWTAMWRGARVVCTDRAIADRIRCLAECAERNYRQMSKKSLRGGVHHDDTLLMHAREARVCPYDWGGPVDEITKNVLPDDADGDATKGGGGFDIVLAADCIYMPELHGILLDSIRLLLADHGVALLPFALHGNTADRNVWGFVERATSKAFAVERLGAQQLTPQACGMDSKRALVHMLRLTTN